MKKLLLLLFISIYSISGFTQAKGVPFVAYWQVGDKYDFKVSKVKQDFKGGIETKNTTNEYLATFEVIDSTETSYTIKWKYQLNLASDYEIDDDLKKKLSKYEFSEVIYKTSEVGAFVEIVNWEEVKDLMNNVFNDILSGYKEKLGPEKFEAFSKLFAPIIASYNTKEGIEQAVFKELQYFHYLMGFEFNTEEPLVFEDQLPNMFGGKPLKGAAKISVKELDEENSFVVMKHVMELDENDTKKMLKQVFDKMGLDSKAMKKMIKNSDLKITDDNTYEFFYYPCIPSKIETVRQTYMLMAGVERVKLDKTLIELITYDDSE